MSPVDLRQAELRPLMRFNLLMPGSPPLAWFKIQGSLATPDYGLAVSPDGRFVVYLADIGATTQLYLRIRPGFPIGRKRHLDLDDTG